MKNTLITLNLLPLLFSALVWSACILAVLIVGYHVYCVSTRICLKLKFGILLLFAKAKLWIQRYLLRKPVTRYNCQQEQPSFATLTLSDLSPESNPVLPISQSEKQSFQKMNAKKRQKRDNRGRFMRG